MNATVSEYASRAKAGGHRYFIHATDTFSYEDYPVFCPDAATVVSKHDSLNGLNMQRVNGVYDSDGNHADMSALRAAAKVPAQQPGKTYLGDGLYARYDGFQVSLSAENGAEVTAEVHLEPEVVTTLAKFFRANNIPLE